jgi:CRISPR/Cas system-associated exonuclease Cas4 (RecB family)
VADRKDALRALGERLLESVTEYQRALYHEFLAAREEISWRYRYAEAARRDLEEATARASELRERLEGLQVETNAQSQVDALTASALGVEHAAAEEDLARTEGLARAAEAVLSRPEFAFRDQTECEELVSEHAREAVEMSEKLKQAVEEAFEQGERDIREATELPPTEPGS